MIKTDFHPSFTNWNKIYIKKTAHKKHCWFGHTKLYLGGARANNKRFLLEDPRRTLYVAAWCFTSYIFLRLHQAVQDFSSFVFFLRSSSTRGRFSCRLLSFFSFFLSSLLLSSSTRRRFYPQRSSGQAVVTGVVPSPLCVPLNFIAHRVQHSHCSSIFIECC